MSEERKNEPIKKKVAGLEDLSQVGIGDDAIDKENLDTIGKMSPEEIKEARDAILA